MFTLFPGCCLKSLKKLVLEVQKLDVINWQLKYRLSRASFEFPTLLTVLCKHNVSQAYLRLNRLYTRLNGMQLTSNAEID